MLPPLLGVFSVSYRDEDCKAGSGKFVFLYELLVNAGDLGSRVN